MCGVFGFIGRPGRRPDVSRLVQIALATEVRGRDAWGCAWIDAAGALHTYREPGPIQAGLDVLVESVRDAVALIGHCRWATHGDPEDNRNNHPHAAGPGGAVVHNGVIRNYRELYSEHGLQAESECDSEIIGALIASGSGPALDRVQRAVNLTAASPLVVLGLFADPLRLVAARDGNPLHTCATAEGIYLASLAQGMPSGAAAVGDNTVRVFRHAEGAIRGKLRENAFNRSSERPRVWPGPGRDCGNGRGRKYAYRGLFAAGD